jgi:hypothetical protein
MATLDYVWEKLYQATHGLAVGQGNIKERLFNAFLSLNVLHDDDFPAELQESFGALVEQITRVEPRGGEGTIQATINTIDDDEAAQMAETIVSLYNAIATRYYMRDTPIL